MKTLKELAADHPYYCHTANFYSREPGQNHATWEEFLDEWGDADADYNFPFRWDIKSDAEDENEEAPYRMEIFFMLQRKGIFFPVTIDLVTEEDIPSIVEYLTRKWEYIKRVWAPLSVS